MAKQHLLLGGAVAAAVTLGGIIAVGNRSRFGPRPVIAAVQAQPASPGIREELVSGGVSRSYLLYVPAALDQARAVPLVVNLHGYNSNPEQQARYSGFSAKADEQGFIVVYPQGTGDNNEWHTGPREGGQAEVQFVRDLIASLQSRYNIDSSRIYATGMSNGGGMTNRLGCEMADVFAAIAPVSGNYQFYQDCPITRALPVLAFHGTDDRLIAYDGKRIGGLPPVPVWAQAWAERDGCTSESTGPGTQPDQTQRRWDTCRDGATVVLTTVTGGSHAWPRNATDEIWSFFAAHPMQ